jgi:hypothetical protein
MNADRTHRVPLTPDMLVLFASVRPEKAQPEALVLPAPKGEHRFVDAINGRPVVPQGLRSTFRDWVAEKTALVPQLAKMALAHKVNNQTDCKK